MALSYTGMARFKIPRLRRRGLSGLGCPCQGSEGMGDLVMGVSTTEAKRWLDSLNPQVRASLEAEVKQIVAELPPAAIEKVFPQVGLGFVLDPGIATALSSLLTTGASVYTTLDANKTNADISKAASKTEAAIAAANAAMSGQASTSMSAAQVQANQLAASTKVKTSLIWGGVAALAVISGITIYVAKSKRK